MTVRFLTYIKHFDAFEMWANLIASEANWGDLLEQMQQLLASVLGGIKNAVLHPSCSSLVTGCAVGISLILGRLSEHCQSNEDKGGSAQVSCRPEPTFPVIPSTPKTTSWSTTHAESDPTRSSIATRSPASCQLENWWHATTSAPMEVYNMRVMLFKMQCSGQNRGQYCAKTHETKLVLTAKIRALQWHSVRLKKQRLSARVGIATNDSELRRQRAGHAFQNANGGTAVVKMWIALIFAVRAG
ncbi:hypothetical protein B0H13DRAFT_1877603 [Mycena leptocephala]|nr:hypothetical protein B0H13DRAFT_1877603 [Mycena leptocephala]